MPTNFIYKFIRVDPRQAFNTLIIHSFNIIDLSLYFSTNCYVLAVFRDYIKWSFPSENQLGNYLSNTTQCCVSHESVTNAFYKILIDNVTRYCKFSI